MSSVNLIKKYCAKEWLPIFELNKKVLPFSAKETIFNQGDPVKGIFIIENGNVKVVSNFSDNDRRIIRLATKGMILGHRGINKKFYPVAAETLTDTTVTFIPTEIFLSLFKANPSFAIYILNFMSEELSDIEEALKCLQIPDPKTRVAQVLIKQIKIFGYDKLERKKLSFTLSRTDIANITGLTYETIIRTLSFFEKQKLIELRGKSICIVNEQLLTKQAGKNFLD